MLYSNEENVSCKVIKFNLIQSTNTAMLCRILIEILQQIFEKTYCVSSQHLEYLQFHLLKIIT